MGGRKLGEDDPCDSLEMGAGEEGRVAAVDGLPQSWRGDCGLNLVAQREKGRSAVSLIASLA